jgi:hypothetical protein
MGLNGQKMPKNGPKIRNCSQKQAEFQIGGKMLYQRLAPEL